MRSGHVRLFIENYEAILSEEPKKGAKFEFSHGICVTLHGFLFPLLTPTYIFCFWKYQKIWKVSPLRIKM